MKPADNIEKLIRDLHVLDIDTSAEMDQRIVHDALKAQEKVKETRLAKTQPNIWRAIMKRPITKLAAVAAIIIAVLIGINYFGVPIDGASKVFAAAIDSVKCARTFSCKRTLKYTQDGQKRVLEEIFMFKEPYHERHVHLSGVDQRLNGQVTITHYGKRQQLFLNPFDKTAILYNRSSSSVVDANTGKLELEQLNTSIRDQLLALSTGEVEDLGNVELDGQSARLLQSRWNESVIKIWINSKTTLPIQLLIQQPKQHWLYTSIQIDEELDDDLFSLEPPEGYRMLSEDPIKPQPDDKAKMTAKMMHLFKECMGYAQKHDGQFPTELADLTEIGVTEETLRTLLAAPGQPNGPAVIRYLQLRKDADWSTEVVLYEIYDEWPDGGIMVGFADGHCALIVDQQLFEELLK